MAPRVVQDDHRGVLGPEVRLSEPGRHRGHRAGPPEEGAREDGAVAAVVDQGAAAVPGRVVEPRRELRRAAELPRTGVTSAVTELHGLPHAPRQGEREPVADGGPPRRRPVDHEGLAAGARGREQGLGPRQVRGHRLLDQDRKASPKRPHPELGRGAVVGEDHDRVQVRALEERVVRGMDVDARVLLAEALPEPRRRLGHRDQAAHVAGGDRGEVLPDVVVVEPEDADPNPRGHAIPSASQPVVASRRGLRPARPCARSRGCLGDGSSARPAASTAPPVAERARRPRESSPATCPARPRACPRGSPGWAGIPSRTCGTPSARGRGGSPPPGPPRRSASRPRRSTACAS